MLDVIGWTRCVRVGLPSRFSWTLAVLSPLDVVVLMLNYESPRVDIFFA